MAVCRRADRKVKLSQRKIKLNRRYCYDPHNTTPTAHANKSEKAANRPVHVIRYGTVRATIWRNIVDNGNASRPLYSVTFSRSYKDAQDNWKESGGFGQDDLLVLAKAANDAHSYIHKLRQQDTAR